MAEEKKAKKKLKLSFKEFDPTKYVNVEPVIRESKDKTIVVSFGRMNPITTGHEKLVNAVIKEASKRKASSAIYFSHTQDPKKNPLSYDQKITLGKKAFGNIVKKSPARTIIEVAKELSGKYNNLIIVVGSDRIEEFKRLLNTYNNKEYKYDSIEIVSAGDRDPDADDVSGMSASKLRSLAFFEDFEGFKKGLPKKLQPSAKMVYDMVRSGMGLTEEVFDVTEATLSLAQRRKRGLVMRRYKTKIKAARERAKRRMAPKEKLLKRARKQALAFIRDRLMKNKKYSEMSPSEKIALDKRLERIPKRVIDRIAVRLLPKVRAAEKERLSSVLSPKTESLNSHFSDVFVRDSLDYMFEKYIEEASEADTKFRKKPHMAMKNGGSVKFDKRFKIFRKPMNENKEDYFEDLDELIEATDDFLASDEFHSIDENVETTKAKLRIAQEKAADRRKHERMMSAAKSRDKAIKTKMSEGNSDPSKREYGTDSLLKILKGDTPGEGKNIKESSPLMKDLPRGSRVVFVNRSITGPDEELEGTVVGTETYSHQGSSDVVSSRGRLRIRDDEGRLYIVKHEDAESIEDYE
jgi:hypothetical protein